MTSRPDGARAGGDGAVLPPARLADRLAIEDLATAYAYALDEGDWVRWEALFTPDARIDYTGAGGIAGTPAEVAAWLPDAMAVCTFSLHTTANHEVRFSGPDRATGRVHVFNRNGVVWEGASEIFDVSAVYEDEYRRVGDAWRIAGRVERTLCVTGGGFADLIRSSIAAGPRGADQP